MSTPEIIQLTRQDLDKLVQETAREAAREAVKDILLKLGFDTSDQEAIIEIQADTSYTRRQRRASERVKDWIWKTAIGAFVLGILALLVLGLQTKFGAPGK